MERQLSFAQAEYAGKQKTTRRDKFLAEMEAVMPWARLVALIEPHYPKWSSPGLVDTLARRGAWGWFS